MTRTPRRGALRGAALVGALALTLAACSGDDGSAGDPDAAADEGGELLVWAWDPTVEPIADAYMEANPDVTIELVNAGTGNDQYTALQNAIGAGSGIPDLAQIEYYALPQFAIGESLADLTDLGADELEGTYTPGPWSAVQQGDGVYGLPLDSGPMAMFYNAELFEQHGIAVPTTWDEYVAAGRALQAADPGVFITSDTGDAGLATSLMWQAGGQPFQVDGTTVSIDLADEGSQQYADLWQQLVGEDLLAPISAWSDEWYQGLGNGTIATLVTGAWMPGNFVSGVPEGAGKWRVAPMPQWSAGESVTAENGGSAMSVMEASENKALAYDFLEFASSGDGVALRLEGGGFPATVADLESEEYLAQESEYFGGQKINEVLAQAAADVAEGWQYLPFQVYANSVFNDTVGQAYVSGTTITEGLGAWQDQLVTYGDDQGFTVD
ncbi:sugar ABC transporter substrate-binding protein [Cellulomonas sp. zg-ZUI222]|uniref:Sugar ABC transporter substrate-binding protein n=1 Tax=Cellulomonas wangleii TaxID=2816956 RepID=A0ABX8D3Z5_9CELL|nr:MULTISPECIES: sugar ABC transporter substrate-binding protein [Cellulomonas]MBO0898860.1 sugar ABC transporter substrate-binding protein [Cellulomonas sp. zg-ZUI22]MBO0919722.1 sugar ABC transporter substrate-binding protein [Cellulomonas wangleii]MBO0923851.1 sugar ABC transporter substrate-binding protein [Cellulomonas wangleii]MBO0924133.1 sugar ABC transporter substrate-binding protein [Cellulomonas wangleii]QVI62158.1 sugar ABC transporter substrate-binding protein [Cellulomonas wangle